MMNRILILSQIKIWGFSLNKRVIFEIHIIYERRSHHNHALIIIICILRKYNPKIINITKTRLYIICINIPYKTQKNVYSYVRFLFLFNLISRRTRLGIIYMGIIYKDSLAEIYLLLLSLVFFLFIGSKIEYCNNQIHWLFYL